jgi:hypothetical protein
MDKINAKVEFLNITKYYKVIAAWISFGDPYSSYFSGSEQFKLKPLYTREEYESFLMFLDREYDAGYGGQELYGIIYCEDGIWIDRAEYDGSEWYEVHKYPGLRDIFDESDVLRYERNKKLKRIEDI